MAEATQKDWSYDALVAAGLDPKEYEVVAGELRAVPGLSLAGARVTSKLDRLLGDHVEANRVGAVYVGGRFLLAETPHRTERRPDLSFVASERAQRPRTTLFEGGPDLAIEVLSPSDPSDRLRTKLQDEYFPAGTREGWVVDPALQTITVLRPGEPSRAHDRGDVLESAVLPDLRLALDEVFSILD